MLYNVCIKVKDIPGVPTGLFAGMRGKAAALNIGIKGEGNNNSKPPALTRKVAEKLAKHYKDLN